MHSLGNGSTATCCAALASVLMVMVLLRRRRRLRGRDRQTLQEGIAEFYDASSKVWVDIWGEHMHHGYYPEGFRGSLADHQKAQVTMVEEILRWAGVPEPHSPGAPQSFLDVGCGVGGSSRHLQRKYGGTTAGITLSPQQRALAEARSAASGQAGVCRFLVADALRMPFPDNSFDLVWSLESGEHMPDKARFMGEMHRVCKPGGRIILVTWVHRNLEKQESLKSSELRLLRYINKAYHLPDWCSISDYANLARGLGMAFVRTDDWTTNIMPFWAGVMRTALQPRGWRALAEGGWQTLRGAMVMPLMALGYQRGTLRFGLLTGTKAAQGPLGAVAKGPAATARGSLLGRRATAVRRRCGGSISRPAIETVSSPMSVWSVAKVLWDFSRPHTLLGTLISVPMIHLFAAAPFILQSGSAVIPLVLASILQTLPPALLMNVYITGLNQIFDVDIDKINKPSLPIPAGRLSVGWAWITCLSCLGLAAAWASMSFNGWLHMTLAGSALLGSAYSMPPVRLKRSPFLAAFSIIVVRGIVVNLGFYLCALEALRPLGVIASVDLRGALAAGFFAVMGVVIALLKDVPDVLGDKVRGIRSFSVRVGPEKVFTAAVAIVWSTLLTTAAAFGLGAVNAANAGLPVVAMSRAALSATSLLAFQFLVVKRRGVDTKSPSQVYSFYMDLWKVFYVSYLFLPLAQ